MFRTMSATMRCLTKLNVGLSYNIFLRSNGPSLCRFIYSEENLGMQGYENARTNSHRHFLNVDTIFRTKMREACESESSMIFTEDLKSMLHLAEKKSEDTELLIKMLKKFHKQNKDMRFGMFIFGPVVMRTFYYLNEPELALTAFKDPQFEGFFNQYITYKILLSLLYKHEKYSEIRDIYDMIKNKNLPEGYPRNCLLLVIAACYKENTPEALEYALNLWKELSDKGFMFTRKTISFLAALTIKQNASHIAIEILSTIRDARYIDVRCLKIWAYTEMKRFTEIVSIIRSSLEHDRPNTKKELYFHDVIEQLEKTMTKENIPEDFELYKLIDLLKKNEHILSEKLENHLCVEVNTAQRRPQGVRSNLMQRLQPISGLETNTRPVLRDLL